LLVSIVVAAAGVCAPGCARRDSLPDAPVTMRIGVGTPRTSSEGTGADAFIKTLFSDPWLATKPDGRLTDRVATSATWDAAGTTLRLKLRSDVYFHDGTLLTPDIAAQALRERAGQTLNFNSIESVTPSGADTVDIKLKERNAFVLTDLSGLTVTKPGAKDIGVGPYRITQRAEQDATLEAFPRYFRGRPGLSGIEVRTYPTQRNAWTALMRGEIDMLHEVSRDAADFVKAESGVRTYSFLRPYYIDLVFSVRHPILKNPEVRKAINQALDRTALVRDGMNGRGIESDGPISPQHWAYAPSSKPFKFDPASARERLDRAGFKPKAASNAMMPSRLAFNCLVFSDDSRFERLAVLVQKQLADVGIDMKLQPVSQEVLVDRAKRGDFDALIFESAGRSLNWVHAFWRSSEDPIFNTGYVSADAVLDRVKVALTEEDTRAAVAELDRVFHDDPPAAFIAWQQTSRAVSTRFDVAGEENRDILANLWLWRPVSGFRQARR
jgi:ABC-type transport system substrate-binding protein